MNPDETAPPADVDLRAQLSSLSGLLVLSMRMFDRADADAVMRLAVAAVTSLGPCRAVASYRMLDGRLELTSATGQPPAQLTEQLAALAGEAGPVVAPDNPWTWALALRGLGECHGYLVVTASSAPSDGDSFLLKVLARLAGTAMAAAELLRTQRAMSSELDSLSGQLSATTATLQQQTRIHEVLTGVATSGDGEQGIADAVHDLISLPVIVEDRSGNLRAWAGPGRPPAQRKPTPRDRDELLARAAREGRPIRDRDRLVALTQPRKDVLGVISLVDPGRAAGQQEMLALEHGATVLALQLEHRRGMAEVELRRRRDLVDDLVSGTDDASAVARAALLSHRLVGVHHVLVVNWNGQHDDVVARAVERAASNLEMGSLLAKRAGHVVLIAPGRTDGAQLHAELSRLLRSASGGIGIGGPADGPAEYPRSYGEAVHALEARQASRHPAGVTAFTDLGTYRILAAGDDTRHVEQFVREWLGDLLDYDAERNTALVETLYQYFEHGGNYDATAESLLIHRSTLRYRLQRIREVTGFDLTQVDSRLNLHLATRALKTLNAP